MYFIALIALNLAAAHATGFEPPGESKVNSVVAIALATDPNQIDRQPGPWRCRIIGNSISGTGDTLENAHAAAGLRCIQFKCASIGDETARFILEDPEMRSILSQLGLDPKLFGHLRAKFEDDGLKKALNEGACFRKDRTGALSRMMAYDSCFGAPSECSREPSCDGR